MRLVRLPSVLLGCVMAMYATALLLASPFLTALGDPTHQPPLGDFGSLFASAQAAAERLDPYAVYPLTMGTAINLNAPASLLLLQPLTLADPYRARSAWFALSLLAYAISVALLHLAYRDGRGVLRLGWAFAQAGLWETLALGQIYTLLALPTTIAWLTLARRPVLAGALIGIVAAVKPNFLVWPALLMLVGHRRAAVSAIAATALLSLLAVVTYGPGVYAEWLAVAGISQPNPQAGNGALAGVLARVGLSALAPVVEVGGLAALAVWAWRRQPGVEAASGAALVGSLLFAPLAWVGYSVFLLPIFFRGAWSVPLSIAAGLLLIPRLVAQDLGSPATSAYCLAWVLVLIDVMRRADAQNVMATPMETSTQAMASAIVNWKSVFSKPRRVR